MENENKKVKQVGNLTFGILLIVLGVIFLISMFTEPTWLMHAIDLWPIFLITLDDVDIKKISTQASALIYSYNEKSIIKYDENCICNR